MTGYTVQDLANLPRPEILETLDYDATFAERVARFGELGLSYGYDPALLNLETDPGAVLLQEASYREIVLRARGNDIARARYLYYARGSEVDHLGAFYDCTRMGGEADDRYKARIILAIQGRSTGGTAPRYRSIAMGVSLRVADAVVYRNALDPGITVAVFASDNNGVADAALLAEVRAAVTADTVRMVNDVITVRSAVVQVVPVTASLRLFPTASTGLIAPLAAGLAARWVAESGLGRDLTVDWLKAALMAPGVHSIESLTPATDAIAQPFQAVRIGAVTLTPAAERKF
jgi:phage-related baseplate assembly protein